LTDHAEELKGSSSCENDHNRLNSNELDEDIIRNVSEMDMENVNFDEQIQQSKFRLLIAIVMMKQYTMITLMDNVILIIMKVKFQIMNRLIH